MSTDGLSQPPVKQEVPPIPVDYETDDLEDEDDYAEGEYYPHEEEEHHDWFLGSTAAKFLLAGGIAGAGKFAIIRPQLPFTNFSQFQELAQHPLTV